MLCAEKLKSKDNLSLARAPAKLGKKSRKMFVVAQNQPAKGFYLFDYLTFINIW